MLFRSDPTLEDRLVEMLGPRIKAEVIGRRVGLGGFAGHKPRPSPARDHSSNARSPSDTSQNRYQGVLNGSRVSRGHALKKSIVFAVAALTSCQQSDSKAAHPPKTVVENSLKVSSKVHDLRIAPASTLPTNPQPKSVDEYCSGYAIEKPTTLGGKLASTHGWIVTSETKLGGYDAITFVGSLDPMTSGTCVHRDGNLAVFDGPRLKAIGYRSKPPKGADPDNLAFINGLGVADQIDPRRIRLYWGLPSPPFADVILSDGIFIEPTAKEDRVCSGVAKIPNLFDSNIWQARKKLRSYGWLPKKPDELETGGEDLVRRGVTEVESCSGTGYGFCAFNYRHRKGFDLRVITMGEGYGVTSAAVECATVKN